MKKVLRSFMVRVLVVGIVLLAAPNVVLANEGTAWLSGENTDASCFATSIYLNEGEYRLVLTCRNLTVPPQAETLFYIVWAHRVGASEDVTPKKGISGLGGKGAYLFLGDITSGKLSARAREAFDKIIVTVEKNGSPSVPDAKKIVLEGEIKPIDFEIKSEAIKFWPSEPPVSRVTIMPTTKAVAQVPSSRSVVGTAFRVFLTILGVIVLAAIVISVLQRRSASK